MYDSITNPLLRYAAIIGPTVLIVILLSILVRKALTVIIERNSDKIGVDSTGFVFIKNSISFILMALGLFWIFYNIPYFKSLGNTLFASVGVFAAIVGFASQKAFSNIVGGLFILIFKPFKVSDSIELSNTRQGVVEEITLRHTIIKDYENRRVVIPNSVISEETIINSDITDNKVRKYIEVGISYESDVDLAFGILAKAVEEHPFFIDNRTRKEKHNGQHPVTVRLISLGDFAVTIRAYAWAKNFDEAFVMKCDVLKTVKAEFTKQGVEIPYPHRTIVYKNQTDAFS
ncbi:mechanosensitive ion channel protein MscS (plasmid) [Fulvitalea axinellae]|uniref:Mechanosensitive ion channel protein MscS n=1 Tax=Fulvitalea axinellae TaxID=1182444 RepID=A0AAU9CKG4_9BACT|nr:mechanosensitive ion channel protein MscS [Fulvitalea axinellae]